MSSPQFPNVTAVAKANVYFDGKVISHTILSENEPRRTLGLIFPGSYHFGTDLAEDMLIVAGSCTVTLDGASEAKTYQAGASFYVPGKSGFTIEVADGLCEYVCAFVS